MKHNKNTTGSKMTHLSLRSLTLGLALAGCGVQGIAATSYTLTTDFTTVAAASGGFIPYKIKANGQIFGKAATVSIVNNAQSNVPQLYDISSGIISNLDTLVNGDIFVSSNAINAGGQAVGQVSLAGSTTGVSRNVFVRNADGTVIDLGLFAGTTVNSVAIAVGINDAGQIIGSSSGTSMCDWRAFTGNVNGGGLQSLGSLGGGTYDWTQAYAINASGQTVGRSSPSGACLLSDTWHAFVSTPTGLKDLQSPAMPVINPGSGGSTARAINDFGFVAGEYPYAWAAATRVYPGGVPIMHAVIWDTVAGTYTDLGKPNFRSSLLGINASGQAVGVESSTALASPAHAVVGDVAGGVLTDLNGLVSNIPTGWTLGTAFDISDTGQILVSALDAAGIVHYALLTPSTTPVALPAAPTNLASKVASSMQINLTWADNATNETAQYLERCQGAGCTNFMQIASLATGVTSYSNTALIAATAYSYRIRSHGAAGDSAYSNIATATTSAAVVTPPAATTVPAAPSGLSSVAISRSKVVLSWLDNATNEKNYLIERCKGLTCTNFSKIATVGANVKTYSNAGLSANTSYSYRVRASNAVGKSACSNVISVITLP
jgi:uncharacterized membrane protein